MITATERRAKIEKLKREREAKEKEKREREEAKVTQAATAQSTDQLIRNILENTS